MGARLNPKHDAVTDIVIEYCSKYKQAGDHTIARMIKQDFEDRDDVRAVSLDGMRSRVKFRRGHMGANHRQHIAVIMPRVLDPKTNPLALPDAYADPYAPYQLPNGKGLLLADLHIPYHDVEATTAAILYAREKGHGDFVVLNGDVLDFYAESYFSHDPTKPHFVKERDAWFLFADVLRDCFPKAKIIYKMGNHDLRFEHYMWNHAPEMYGLDDTSFESVMRLKEWNVDVVGASSPMRYGELDIFHGHEWGGGSSSPVNPARTAFLKTGRCTMVGHSHQESQHPFKNSRDEIVRCWSVGCLCDLHPAYRPVNAWGRGFALLNLCKDWSVDNKAIYKGRVL